jgi:hypothetical protein
VRERELYPPRRPPRPSVGLFLAGCPAVAHVLPAGRESWSLATTGSCERTEAPQNCRLRRTVVLTDSTAGKTGRCGQPGGWQRSWRLNLGLRLVSDASPRRACNGPSAQRRPGLHVWPTCWAPFAPATRCPVASNHTYISQREVHLSHQCSRVPRTRRVRSAVREAGQFTARSTLGRFPPQTTALEDPPQRFCCGHDAPGHDIRRAAGRREL